MALIVFTSAAGSPGVTTTGVGLALTWPRPVLLVEADPTGGSAVLAGYFRGSTSHPAGLIDLAWADRQGSLAATLPELTMPIPDSQAVLLPGVRAHGQSRSLTGVWESLTATLKGLESTGQDVLVDAGRLGLTGSPEPLIFGADLTLLTVRTDLVALSAARSWAETLRSGFDQVGAAGRLGLLLVGDGRPYGAREVSKVLQLPVTAALPWDPDGAAVFSRGATPPRRFDRSPLTRGLRAAAAAIDATVNRTRDSLETATVGGAGREAAARSEIPQEPADLAELPLFAADPRPPRPGRAGCGPGSR